MKEPLKITMSNSLYDLLTQEDIKNINKISNSAEFQTIVKIAQKHFGILLGSQIININLEDPKERELVKLNQIYVNAVNVFLSILTRSSVGEAIEYHDDNFIMPNYDFKEENVNITYSDFIDKGIAGQDY